MKSYIAALRAITAVYLNSILKITALVVMIIFLASMILIGYLAYQFSVWWWIFAVPIALLFMVAVILFVLIWLACRRMLPRPLKRDERRVVLVFTEKVSRVAEQARTPYPLIVFHIAKDALFHRESRFLKEIVDDSSTLKDDFTAVRRLFK